MPSLASLGFWLACASLAYVYAGYPLLVVIFGRLRRRHVHQQPIVPRMSLIIAAYNEEECIGRCLDAAVASDYPQHALEILVVSDGSSDATETIVARYEGRGVRLLRLPRRGKIHALNAAAARASGEVLVFCDANVVLEARALRTLARNFADPEVGGVAANTSYSLPADCESSSRGEDLYWNYDTWLKQMESWTGSVVSAHGALYAIRRGLYHPIPDAAVTDDFAISTGVVEQGHRLVFEREARAYEPPAPRAGGEFRRRMRLMTRGLRALVLRRRLLNPFRYGFYSLELFSHKVLRRLLPLSLLVLLATSVVLSDEGMFYAGAVVAQGVFYLLASLGWYLRRTRLGNWRLLYIPFFYCLANAAALAALARFAFGDRIELWSPQRQSRTVP